jgi:hypothetical protein
LARRDDVEMLTIPSHFETANNSDTCIYPDLLVSIILSPQRLTRSITDHQ